MPYRSVLLVICVLPCLSYGFVDTSDITWGPCEKRSSFRPLNTSRAHQILSDILIRSVYPWWINTRQGTQRQYESKIDPPVPECANISVLLNWDDTEGKHINHHLMRILADPSKKVGSIWLLNGGPGGDGSSLFEFGSEVMVLLDSKFDVYMPDHRGTGMSSPLECPSVSSCPTYLKETWGEGVHFFSTLGAAKDLEHTIELTRQPGDEVYIYGLSYGTYWMNRYLQIAPKQATAVVMDGICPSSLCRYTTYDINANAVGRDFMTLCGQDPFCSSVFNGKNPYAVMDSMYSAVRAGKHKCGNELQITQTQLASRLSMVLTDFDLRVLIPPVVFRMERCSAADVDALKQFFGFINEVHMQMKDDTSMLRVLGDNILLSEMWYGTDPSKTPPSVEELQRISDEAFFATYGPPSLAAEYDGWDRYSPNATYYNLYPKISIPLALLNGDLDPQTPYFWAATASRKITEIGTKHSFITVPRSTHCTTFGAPTIDGGPTCGMQLLKSFVLSPNHSLDTKCLPRVLPIDFAGTTNVSIGLSKVFFNTPDMWSLDV